MAAGAAVADICPHCGCELPKQGSRARSDAAHRMLFGVIGEAFNQWPHGHSFTPDNPEHLRSYLFVKAGHYDPVDIRVAHSDAALLSAQLPALVKAYRPDKTPLLHVYPWGVRSFVPRSIAGNPSSKDFHRVASAVYEIIEAAIGVPVERINREMRRVA